jgi:hypothetical protein
MFAQPALSDVADHAARMLIGRLEKANVVLPVAEKGSRFETKDIRQFGKVAPVNPLGISLATLEGPMAERVEQFFRIEEQVKELADALIPVIKASPEFLAAVPLYIPESVDGAVAETLPLRMLLAYDIETSGLLMRLDIAIGHPLEQTKDGDIFETAAAARGASLGATDHY